MNRKLFFLGFILLTLGLANTSQAQRPLTWKEALDLTLTNNPALRQADFQMQEKKALQQATRNLYLPQAELNASYVRLSDNIHLDLTPVRDAITPLYGALGKYGVFSGVPNPDPATQQIMPILPDNVSTQVIRQKMLEGLDKVQNGEWDPMIQKKEFATLQASVNWTLYAGGRIRTANRVASLQSMEAEWKKRQVAADLTTELAQRYYGVNLALQAVKVREMVLDGMMRHLNDATRLYEQGMISKAELLNAKVYASQAQRELDKANRELETAREALSNTLGLQNNEIPMPVSPLFYVDSIPPVTYFLEEARRNNPQLRQVETLSQQAKAGEKVSLANFLPAIGVKGTYDLANKDLSEQLPDWMIAGGLQWTVFDGTARFKKLQAAKMKTHQVEEVQKKAEVDINTLIIKLHNELNMYLEQIHQIENDLAFTDELVRVREKAFEEEMAPGTDVTDARLLQAKTRIERLQAMYGFDTTLARLLQYAGIPEQFTYWQTSDKAQTGSL
ncbi:MAG: TolC family protein [Bacteroidales bacterium]